LKLRRALPLVVASALLVAACGNGADGVATGTSANDTSAPESVLPAVGVRDVATGDKVVLTSVASGDRPLLLWAWAPLCPSCAAEAPGVEAFAGEHLDDIQIVGLGTQDDFDLAQSFVSTYGVKTPQMLWDPGFESWQQLSITSQPTWILFSPDGEEIGRWLGPLPEQEILDAASA
jgi:thiol-disulfide isomerase/thioredoxin